MSRVEELAANLDAVRRRIRDAARAAGREPRDVSLIVVTKFFPASDVRLLVDLGVTDMAENRHQEAIAKAGECADLDVRWHFIGGLQSNKAAAVASYADVVESVDRLKVVGPLQRGATDRGQPVEVLLQVSLDAPGAQHRAGLEPADLSALAAAVDDADGLRLNGLMAVAPLSQDPRTAFTRLAEIRSDFLADHPEARELSAGMSGDLEHAIANGATHVRVGSAVLGQRPVVQ